MFRHNGILKQLAIKNECLFAATWKRLLFKAWKRYTQKQRRVAKYMRDNMRAQLREIVGRWRRFTVDRRRKGVLARRAYARWQQGVWRSGLSTWRVTLRLVRRANAHAVKAAKKRCFNTWRSRVRAVSLEA